MNWSPPEGFWPKLYDDLPDGVDHARFRQAVERAVVIYRNEDTDAGETWREINERLRPQAIERLFEAITKLGKPPPAFMFDLPKMRQFAAFQEQFEKFRARERRERLYNNLIVACTEIGGLRLSDSDQGPLVRVFTAIAYCLFPDGGRIKKYVDADRLSGRGVREIIRRHIKRRRQAA
jgi:hypothetical protein